MDTLLRLFALIVAGYVVLCAFLYLMQDRLIFYPSGVWQEPQSRHVQPVSIERDDVVLRGWLVNPEATGPLLVYYGGNAEELSRLVDVFERLNCTTLLMNYRGYGDSEGSPTAAALKDDAIVVRDELLQRYRDDRPLILFGRSLGTGIAAAAAQSPQVDGLILMSPFRSLQHMAERLFPWLPTSWLLRHQLGVLASVDALPANTLVLYSPTDQIVPAVETRALLRNFPQDPRVVEIDGTHNVPLLFPGVWREVEEFINATAQMKLNSELQP